MSMTPLRIEYQLTEKGYRLNRVLAELAMFAFKFKSSEVFSDGAPPTIDQLLAYADEAFRIPKKYSGLPEIFTQKTEDG